MHKRKIIGILAIIIALMLSGCSESKAPEPPKDTYSAEFAQSPMEYMIFIDKEIAPITNALTTEILLSRHVEQGSITKEKALESANSSLNTINECINEVDIMQPPLEYAETRDNVLSAMDQARADMEEYIAVLKDEKSTSLSSLRSSMQADFILITGEFNVYNE